MIIYIPNNFKRPKKILGVPSAWVGLEAILEDIIIRFGAERKIAIEFGVEYGYSITALSNYFEKVVGIDTFEGDKHTNEKNIAGLYETVKEMVPENVQLIQSKYQDYGDLNRYDLVHVDIVHTYKDTFDCGDWACRHSNLVLFHDTESFPEVKRAVEDLAEKHAFNFYNYPYCNGLGILCNRRLQS